MKAFLAQYSLKKWRTRDLLVLVVISLVLVVITFSLGWVREVLVGFLGVYGHRLVSPLIIFIVFMAGYLVRRPGSSILAALLMGLIASPFLPAGLATVLGYMIGGVLAEIFFVVGRYQTYTLTFMLISGLIYNLIGVGLIWVPFQLGSFGVGSLLAVLGITAVAGLAGGWLTKAVGDAIINSGVMQSYGATEESLA